MSYLITAENLDLAGRAAHLSQENMSLARDAAIGSKSNTPLDGNDDECVEITLLAYRLAADMVSRSIAMELANNPAHQGDNAIGL